MTGHTHRYQGQAMTHDHDNGQQPHGWYGHTEDPSPGSFQSGEVYERDGAEVRPGWPTTDISLRTAPCGNQAAHRAHTYGDRGHTCLGLGRNVLPPASPDAMHREGDTLVARLSPDAHLVTDASTCIVLVTPERRITVSNVDEWKATLDQGRTFAQIYRDEAETRRRDEKQAADHMYAGHIAGLRDRDTLIEHLHRSPDHGENTDAQLSGLIGMTTLDLIREHQHQHGLR